MVKAGTRECRPFVDQAAGDMHMDVKLGSVAVLALATTAMAWSAPAIAGEEVLYAPPPAWVMEAQLPADTRGPPVVLFDDQRRIEGGVLASYTDRAIRIDNPQTLQALGTISAAWMPDKGDLTVHQVSIIRDGAEIDLVDQGARFEVLRREAMLEQRMLDGARTATLTVPGLRVGDVLRTRFTITLADQALGREVQSIAMLPAAPFEATSARILVSWPDDEEVRWQVRGASELAVYETDGPDERLAIALPLPEVDEMPSDAPVRYQMPAMLQVGTFDDWSEVAAVMAPLYETEGTIAPASPLADQIAHITATHEGELERAAAALRLVQDEIAYQLNGMDGGNYLPQAPAQTWDARFGDCKAKSLLLLAMLRAMDIEAQAVLVATQVGDMLPDMLPMAAAFDHVIVHAVINGRDYWLDGTGSGAVPDRIADVPPFHHALPIRSGGSSLMAMTPRANGGWDQMAQLTFDHRGGVDLPVPWTGEWVLSGAGAGQYRGLIGQANEEQIENVVHGFVGGQLEGTWILDTGITYDETSNLVTLNASGLVPSSFAWERGRGTRDFSILPTVSFEFRPDRSRKAWQGIPVALPGPYSQLTQVTVLLPEPAKEADGFELDGREAFTETIAGIQLSRTAQLDGSTLTISDSASWPGGELAFEQIAQERSKASRFGSTELLLRAPTTIERAFDAASRTDRTRFAAIEQAYARLVEKEPEDAQVFRTRAWFRQVTLDREGALADLSRVIELEPDAQGHIARANLLAEMDRLDEALADATLAYELNPALDAAYALAAIYGETGQVEQAIELLEQQNPDAETRGALAMAISEFEARAGRKELGLSRIEDVLARRPGDPQMLNARCWYQATWNFRPEELETICTKAVERADWSPPVLDSRALGYFRLGRYEEALRDLDAALSDSPDQSESLYLRGLVRMAMGDEDGRRDVEEALARQPSLKRRFATWGLGIS